MATTNNLTMVAVNNARDRLKKRRASNVDTLLSDVSSADFLTDTEKADFSDRASNISLSGGHKQFNRRIDAFTAAQGAAKKRTKRRTDFLKEASNILSDRPGLAKQTLLG